MKPGVTSENAKALLKQYGFNELPSAKPKNIWKIALEVIKEPMFILLLACGSLYLILGDYSEGVILLCWIFIIIFITFYQNQKTEKSLESLRQLSSPRALVIRDGKETRIAGREVVPGDCIILNEGDRVPADAFMLESNNLTVDESILTGEFIPVIKSVGSDQTEPQHQIFSGTLVVQGKGLARVLSTGTNTQFGKIGASLQAIEQDKTRLQQETNLLVRNLFFVGAAISGGVVTAFYFTRGNFVQSLLSGIATAMALLPEEFPVVLTIFLALGAWRISKRNVLTRKPSAIETLGSATVLCSDKTGTITQNKMEIAALHSVDRSYYREDFRTGKAEIEALISALFYASATNSIDPMELAIVDEYKKLHANNEHLSLLKEYPLSKDLFAMTRVFASKHDNAVTAFCKGAPESIFSLCHLTDEEIAIHTEIVHAFAQQGLRVIAAAKCNLQNNVLPETQSDFDFSFVGLVGFEDPIRPEVPAAIKECYDAGIRVIMITGDYPATARSIGSKIGLQHHENVLTGDELRNLSNDELKEKIKYTNIFARIIPEQKLQIIQALKANGEIVAMTGDGVNDAPALKAADIGVAMGLKGTDVAREAASLVLLDDNFASIVHAIRSGRRIFDNLQKAMSYIIAIHIPIIGLVLFPAFFPALPILLMPLHIVFLELIIDPVCAIAFESEQEERGIMSRPPRNPNDLFFGFRKIISSLMRGILLFTMVLLVYFLSIRDGHTAEEVRAIAFSSLIIGNVFLILTSLSNTRSFVSILREKNLSVLFISITALVLLFLTISIPFLQSIFSFQFAGYSHFIISIAGASVMLLIFEITKQLKQPV